MQFFALCEILEITDINKTFQMGNKENLFSRFCLVLSALKNVIYRQLPSVISSIFLFSHTNISYIPTITGMVTIDSSVVSTYNELAYAASLSYSCAMDVTVAQAGVMDAIYTVRRICLESFSPANV